MPTDISEAYFEWLEDKINPFRDGKSYHKLLRKLFETIFVWDEKRVPLDSNRAADGIDLRDRFARENDIPYDYIYALDGPCSVLEMMVGLALRCEETIMVDPTIGDRTSEWFWVMVQNMGLYHADGPFDSLYADSRLSIMMGRLYDYDGSGGAMFVVNNPREDMRKTDIWYQMMWWLSEVYRDDDWCK